MQRLAEELELFDAGPFFRETEPRAAGYAVRSVAVLAATLFKGRQHLCREIGLVWGVDALLAEKQKQRGSDN